MAEGLILEEFIDRCNKIHNFTFDYSNVEFVNTRTPVEVRCKKHDNVFMQLPKTHLLGKTSCKQCTNDKKKASYLKKYGVENPSQSSEIKKKKEDTCMKNHGVKYSLESPIIRDKVVQTCIEKFGVENPNQLKEVRDKIAATCTERYGFSTPFQNEEVKEKIKQTNLRVRGVEYPSQSPEVREKFKQTCLDVYGVEYPIQLPEIQEKSKQSCLSKYNVEYSLQSPEVRDKFKQTCIDRFGVENPQQSKDVQGKTIATCIERYGFKTPLMNPDIKIKIKKKLFDVYGVAYSSQIPVPRDSLLKLDDIEYLTMMHHVKENTLESIAFILSVTTKTVADNFRRHGIEIKNFPRSQMEVDITAFITKHSNYKIINNTRKVISKELDIYIPELNFAIEVNGTYYHSELRGKDKHYHLSKFDECAAKGISLLHIWENDWIHSKSIVLSLILGRIGKAARMVNARECTVIDIPASIARAFFTTNHLHGYVNSSTHKALYYGDDLVSVMSFSLNRFGNTAQYEMTRFATKINTRVRGGASKLFKAFLRSHDPESVVTYAQRGLFTGKVYDHLGFVFSHTSQPNQQYFHKSNTARLFSRIKFQKHKLEKELDVFDPSLSAWKNMQINGYDRIWDCGNNVYLFNR